MAIFTPNCFSLAGVGILLCICAGCDSSGNLEPDTMSPEISIEAVNPALQTADVCGVPANNVIQVETGAEISLELLFTDDRELGEYKIDIHHNFDCHSHGKRLVAPWQLIKVQPLKGGREQVVEQIAVPADVTVGDYHLLIQALDAEGNEASFVEFSLKLRNPIDIIAPAISVAGPEGGAVFNRDAEVRFVGSISDNLNLAGGRLDVTYLNVQGTEFTASQVFFEASAGTTMDFDIPFQLPASLPLGEYDFQLVAYDAVGNSGKVVVKVRFE